MITIKNKSAIGKMEKAGQLLANLLDEVASCVKAGISTLDLDQFIDNQLLKKGMISQTKGYKGYRHSSCISLNDEVVHGVPSEKVILQPGDLVKVDVCASFQGYCADMARCFFVGTPTKDVAHLAQVARLALDEGIKQAKVGNRLSDISAAIQAVVEQNGFGVVRDFAGHGIGKRMHEEPEVLNYGKPGRGPLLQQGMTLAIEPMITMGHYDVYITQDNWTVKTVDKSLAAHVEDTIVILENGPKILTRHQSEG